MKRSLLFSTFAATLMISGTTLAQEDMAPDARAGRRGRFHQFMESRGPGPSQMSDDALTEVTGGKREQLKAKRKEIRRKSQALTEQIETKRQNMVKLLSAPTFNKEAFLAASEDIEKLRVRRHRLNMSGLAAVASHLPQEARAKIAERFQKKVHRKNKFSTMEHRSRGHDRDDIGRWKKHRRRNN